MASIPTRTVIRTCIGCRKRANVAELVRLVAVVRGGVRLAVPDLARRLPGRGAWLHPEAQCLTQAERKGAFGRSLRTGPINVGPVREQFEASHTAESQSHARIASA